MFSRDNSFTKVWRNTIVKETSTDSQNWYYVLLSHSMVSHSLEIYWINHLSSTTSTKVCLSSSILLLWARLSLYADLSKEDILRISLFLGKLRYRGILAIIDVFTSYSSLCICWHIIVSDAILQSSPYFLILVHISIMILLLCSLLLSTCAPTIFDTHSLVCGECKRGWNSDPV